MKRAMSTEDIHGGSWNERISFCKEARLEPNVVAMFPADSAVSVKTLK